MGRTYTFFGSDSGELVRLDEKAETVRRLPEDRNVFSSELQRCENLPVTRLRSAHLVVRPHVVCERYRGANASNGIISL